MSETKTTKPPNPLQLVFDASRAARFSKKPDPPQQQQSHKRQRPDDEHTVVQIPAASDGDKDDIYGASKFGGIGDYMANKRRKLQIQNQQLVHDGGSQKPQIFAKLSIYVNGQTHPTALVIRELVLEHGGVFHEHMDRKSMVTHIIASNLTPQKWKELKHMKVVRPDWLVDSAKAGVLLRWSDYRLEPNARIDASQEVAFTQLSSTPAPRVGSSRAFDPSSSSSPASTFKAPSSALASASVVPKKRKISSDREVDFYAPPDKRHGPTDSRPAMHVRVSDLAMRSTTLEDAIDGAEDGAQIPEKFRVNSSLPAPNFPKAISAGIAQPTATAKDSRSDDPHSAPPHKSASESNTPRARSSRPVNPFASPSPNAASSAQAQQVSLQKPSTSSSSDLPKPTSPPPIYATDPVTLKDAARVPGYAAQKSNVAASRKMEDPAWRAEHTAVKEGFINNYHANSRLHLLSTFKAELRELVARAQADAEAAAFVSGSPSKKEGKGKGKMKEERVIMHCDFDCFFVSAGLVERPHLRGKPVVVCHSKGTNGNAESSTSEIASSSYEARACGIRNGMSLRQARLLCPTVTTIPYDFDKYKEFSLKFYTILMRHADDLQAVSIDEALLDVSSSTLEALEHAKQIQDEVQTATGCTVSIGIADNILLARLATRRAKPAGTFRLLRADALPFLDGLKVPDLHGFAHSAVEKLEDKFGAGSAALREVRRKTKGALQSVLGEKTGERLWKACRGIDDTKLESDKPRKSVSSEVNYMIRFESNEEFKKFLDDLSADVASRLQALSRRAKSLTLKLMTRHPDAPIEAPKFLGHGICDTHSKSVSFTRATDDATLIAVTALKLAEDFDFDPKELRGIGIQMQKLEGDGDGTGKGSIQAAFGRAKPQQVEQTHLPSFSQVDPEVFNALPEEYRREMEAEWKRQGVVRGVDVESPPAPAPVQEILDAGASKAQSLPPAPAVARPVPETPTKSKSTTNVKHITKQLAIHSRSTVSPTKSTLGRMFQKQAASAAEVIEIDDDDEDEDEDEGVTVPPKFLAPKPKIASPRREADVFDLDEVPRRRGDLDMPTFSQVDMSVFNEMPDDIRREYEAEWARQKKGPSRAQSAQPAPVAAQETAGAGPSRLSVPPPPVQRSRSATPALREVSPARPVASIFMQTKEVPPPDVSNDELKNLGLAIDVFRALPASMQRDILREHRKTAAVPPPQRSPVKTVRHYTSRTTRSPSVGLRNGPRRVAPVAASFLEEPVLKRMKGGKVLSEHSTTDDLQGLLSTWIEAAGRAVPGAKDVKIFSDYLEECVKQQVGSAAMERAINVLRWWKLLLGRAEMQARDEVVREGWWSAFRQVKTRMDESIRSRFGCPLALD